MTAVMPMQMHAGDLALGQADLRHFQAFAAFIATDASRFLGGPGDLRDAWGSCATHVGQWALRGYGTYWLSQDGEPVGRVGIWHPIWLDEPELSWVIYPAFNGRGLSVLAAKAVIAAWAAAGQTPLMSLVDEDNAASVKIAERLGAGQEGTHRYDHGKVVLKYRHQDGAAA